MRLSVPQLRVVVLGSDGTEVDGLGGVEKVIGFRVDTGEGICYSIARSLDVADVRHERGWLTAVMVSVELTDQLLQPDYLRPEAIKLSQGWSAGCRPEGW